MSASSGGSLGVAGGAAGSASALSSAGASVAGLADIFSSRWRRLLEKTDETTSTGEKSAAMTSGSKTEKPKSGLLVDHELLSLGETLGTLSDIHADLEPLLDLDPTHFADFHELSQATPHQANTERLSHYRPILTKTALEQGDSHGREFRDTLVNKDFKGKNLKNKKFYCADFDNCCFDGSNMTHVQLIGCDLRGVNLSNVIGLQEKNLIGCIWDETTQFPEGFNITKFRTGYCGTRLRFEDCVKQHAQKKQTKKL